MNKMTLIDKTFLLKKTPLFRALTLEMLLPIADKLVQVSFDAGDVIFNVDDEAHRMYFLIDGAVEVRGRNGNLLALLQNESFFGDEALFNDSRRGYSAHALADSEIVTLSQTNLFTIISEYPSVALGFLSVYATALPDRAKLHNGESL